MLIRNETYWKSTGINTIILVKRLQAEVISTTEFQQSRNHGPESGSCNGPPGAANPLNQTRQEQIESLLI